VRPKPRRTATRISTPAAARCEVNERVQELAAEHDASMAQIALAWLFEQDAVDAPIVGTTSVEHLEEAVAALELSLSDSELAYVQEPYEPVPVSGHD
jgi:aryl-alcohol dehydrogenase-like predicted oxidoreductase